MIILLLLLTFNVNGQVLTIQDKNGNPLELVFLKSNNPTQTATSNSLGQIDISAFKNASCIEIQLTGYKMVSYSYEELAQMNFIVVLKEKFTEYESVVISVTKWIQPTREVPSKVTILTKKEIRLINPQTAADLLGSSGEVFIQKSQQGGGSPMIRGFSTKRLLYSVDGVRMNNAIFRSGNIQNIISLDAFAIENSEVIFGPGSILYGSDAIGGVMSFHTLKPKFSVDDSLLIKGNVVSRYSSANNENTHHLDVNFGWKKWAALTSITYSDFGDLKMGKNGPDEYLKPFFVVHNNNLDEIVSNPNPRIQNPTGYNQINLMQKLRFQPNKNWDIEYAFHFSETSDFSRYDRLIETAPNGLPVSAVWNYGPQKWMMNHLTINRQKKTHYFDQFTIHLAQQTFEESRIDRRFNHHRLRTQLEKVQAYSVNVDFQKRYKKQLFHYGMEYVFNEVLSEGSAIDIRDGSTIPVPSRYPAALWNTAAIYLNYQYQFSNKYLLQAGARYSHFLVQTDFTRHLSFYPFEFTESTLQNGAPTGSVGLIYTPEKTWKISTHLSNGFRAPNIDDMGKLFDFARGEIVIPNTNLQAEFAYNGEINVSKTFGDYFKLDFTGFYTFLDNALVRRTFQLNEQDSLLFNGEMSQIYAIQNAAFGEVFGLNVGFIWKLSESFNLTTRYNFQRGIEEMEDGNISRSRHAAPAFGITRLNYQYKDLIIQFYAHYSAEVTHQNLNEEEKQKPFIYAKDVNGNPYSPGWYTLNFKVMYQFHRSFTINLGLENITGQRYRPYSSGLVAAGRSFIISLRASL